jgi:5-methylcytosine-specific restriction enzyme B
MSRYQPNRDPTPILEAAADWSKRCLICDGSVLSDNEDLWTPRNLDELDRAFVQNFDAGEGNFLEKLQKQLNSTPPPSRRLMAEALWFLMLFQSNITAERQVTNIRSVWEWSREEFDAGHPLLSDAVLGGLGSAGAAHNTQRWRELSFLITLTRAFKGKPPEERAALLSDTWRFAEWLDSYPDARHRQFRHICLHLLFPDQFERISSSADKRRILGGFTGERERDLRRWNDERIDRALLELRGRLEAERGTAIDFYEPELSVRWRGEAKTWLLSWNPENWNWTNLQADRAATARGEPVVTPWSCVSSKPKEGDHAFQVAQPGARRNAGRAAGNNAEARDLLGSRS